VAQRLGSIEKVLIGVPLAEAANAVTADHLSALAPIDDVRGSADYRIAAALTMTRDVLAELAAEPMRRVA
jgi:CO/xanthine dehydrogenase FAD-binding subunit